MNELIITFNNWIVKCSGQLNVGFNLNIFTKLSMIRVIMDEFRSIVISSMAIIVTTIFSIISVYTGFTTLVSKQVDNYLIQLGLMPQYMISKLIDENTYSYIYINIVTFIIIHIIFIGFTLKFSMFSYFIN